MLHAATVPHKRPKSEPVVDLKNISGFTVLERTPRVLVLRVTRAACDHGVILMYSVQFSRALLPLLSCSPVRVGKRNAGVNKDRGAVQAEVLQ